MQTTQHALAVPEAASMPNNNSQRCASCRFWSLRSSMFGAPYQACDAIGDEGDAPQPADGAAAIAVRVDDDSNLDVELRTGPDFGCTLHEPRLSATSA